jgi:predicted nucleic acid-binding protein
MLTIDANVFVSARVRTDVHHFDSDQFLKRIVQAAVSSFCPTLVIPETAAAIARPTGDAGLAHTAVLQIESFPYLSLVGLTQTRARQAAEIAIVQRLRGADAVYVATAQEFGTILVSWDTEILTRGTAVVLAMTPTAWLAANPTI